ncbi:flagellar radial spoke protein 3 [Cyclospora cayetanensis]|uniref:Flagellar radial spoke protein 3 n=1 Tax=Cyclospora cayetanensis TaxID=88456 RepID=A0A6P6S2V8_9EIME|nr:flagellar radial spoke protein 3 [Cyclospora cayetanensis]
MATLGPRLPPAASPATDTLTPRPPVRSCNMMFDKRILRGVPFKLLKEQESPLASSSSVFSRDKLMRAQRTSAQASLLKQKQKHQRQPQQRTMRGATVVPSFPVDGGKEIGLQTDPHIVTLTAVTKEADASAQTDAIRDRPMSPLLALRAELVDAHTQIQDGELFNFDEEVVPVLEVLIGRVIEQSLSEVVQEEELTAIQQQREAFERERLQQIIAVQALEAATQRRQQEAARRVAEAAAHVKLEQFAAQKRDAVAFAKKLLKGSDAALLEELREEGLFLAPSTVSCRCEGIFQTDMCGYYIWRAGTADRKVQTLAWRVTAHSRIYALCMLCICRSGDIRLATDPTEGNPSGTHSQSKPQAECLFTLIHCWCQNLLLRVYTAINGPELSIARTLLKPKAVYLRHFEWVCFTGVANAALSPVVAVMSDLVTAYTLHREPQAPRPKPSMEP